MKLLKHVKLFGEHTGSLEEATLQDIRQAAKEMGYVVVPSDPEDFDSRYFERLLDAVADICKERGYIIGEQLTWKEDYRAMIKAAEASE